MSPVPALQSLGDFDRVFDVFHGVDPDPDSDLVFLKAIELGTAHHGPPKHDALWFILNSYLREWGDICRVAGPVTSGPDEYDTALSSLEEVLRDHWGAVAQVRKHTLSEVVNSARARDDIEYVFNDLVAHWRLEPLQEGQARPRAVVGVAKLLAVLAPGVCVIWDNEYVFKKRLQRLAGAPDTPPWRPPSDGLGYAQYIVEKASQFYTVARSAAMTPVELERAVVAEHSRHWHELHPDREAEFFEPLTKILDEANYLDA